jgi:hypothetical protein
MYAALVSLTIDPAQATAAAAAFTSKVLPRVQTTPGFQAGYWLDPVEGQGFGFLLFESEEQALAGTPPAVSWPGGRDPRARCPAHCRRDTLVPEH